MIDFESKMLNSIKNSMSKQIDKIDFIAINYQDRFAIPQDFINQAWELVDQKALIQGIANRLECELVDRVVNQFAAEIATDIKQVLSVKERREAIRSLVRDNIDQLTRI